MTEMPRKTISLPPELENAVYELRKSEKYCKCSFSEILRVMIRRGLDAEQAEGTGREDGRQIKSPAGRDLV